MFGVEVAMMSQSDGNETIKSVPRAWQQDLINAMVIQGAINGHQLLSSQR